MLVKNMSLKSFYYFVLVSVGIVFLPIKQSLCASLLSKDYNSSKKLQFFSSVSSGYSKGMSKSINTQTKSKGSDAIAYNISLGYQINSLFASPFYINAETFFMYHNSKTTTLQNSENLSSSFGLLSRFGYNFFELYSVYAGIGIAQSRYVYSYNNSGSSATTNKLLPSKVMVFGLTFKPKPFLEVFTEAKYIQTNEVNVQTGSSTYDKRQAANASILLGVRHFI